MPLNLYQDCWSIDIKLLCDWRIVCLEEMEWVSSRAINCYNNQLAKWGVVSTIKSILGTLQ